MADSVRAAAICAISLARHAIVAARGWAANSINARVRLTAESDRLQQESELLREEIPVKDARTAKTDPRRRPYCRPTEGMGIPELKAAQAWSLAQTAGAFLAEPVPVASWLERIDEGEAARLVHIRQPVNKW